MLSKGQTAIFAAQTGKRFVQKRNEKPDLFVEHAQVGLFLCNYFSSGAWASGSRIFSSNQFFLVFAVTVPPYFWAVRRMLLRP